MLRLPNTPRLRQAWFALVNAVAACFTLNLPLPAQAAPEEITYLLPAPATLPAFAPWMIAMHNGYYADENIKVNFVAARGGVDVAKQLGAGTALVGGAIGDTAIIVRANGVPVKVVAILGAGALAQLAVHAAGPIKTVADMKGKTLTVTAYTDSTYYALLGNLKTAGLTKADVTAQAAGPTGVWQLFAAGKSEGMAAVPDWIISAEEAGAKVRILSGGTAFPSMAQAILASDEAIKTKPETVRRLVRATLRGMQDIMRDPKAAAAVYVKAVPHYAGQQAVVERIFQMYRERVYGKQRVLGEVNPKRLDAVQRFYVAEGIVPMATPLNDLFTNQFIGVARD